MSKKIENKPIMLRLNNVDVLTMINEIDKANIYKSKNELINKMLEYGAPELYNRVFNKSNYTKSTTTNGIELLLSKLNDIETHQKKRAGAENEIFSLLTIIEFLTTTLLNIEIAKIEGKGVSVDGINAGLYATLPAQLENLKSQLLGKL